MVVFCREKYSDIIVYSDTEYCLTEADKTGDFKHLKNTVFWDVMSCSLV